MVPNKMPLCMYDLMDDTHAWLIRVTDFNIRLNYPSLIVVNVTEMVGVIDYIDSNLKLKELDVDEVAKPTTEVTPNKVPEISIFGGSQSSSNFVTPSPMDTKRKSYSPQLFQILRYRLEAQPMDWHP